MTWRKIRNKLRGGHSSRFAEIDPDEILLDSHNLPRFDTQQFEGKIEKPISKRTVAVLGLFFAVIGIGFLWRIGELQIAEGEMYAARSENNRLRQVLIFADRGIIYDRNGTELAWNSPAQDAQGSSQEANGGGRTLPERSYINSSGFGHLLGYVKPPLADQKGFYYQTEFAGMEGAEKAFDDILGGQNGLRLSETNALGDVVSESLVRSSVDGQSITLTVDGRLQRALFAFIKQTAAERGFDGGAGVIMDVRSGAVLALTSFPEYDPNILSQGQDRERIAFYSTSDRTPFLNRAVSGLYTPGSTVKPFIALGALAEGVVTPHTNILSTGAITVPNPYDPEHPSVFTDWKAHGYVDMEEALAVSSNVYFYAVGGGYRDQKGIGIKNIEHYARMFKLDAPTTLGIAPEQPGIIPTPEWKAETFDGEIWRLGDTYNTAIGQYGFQLTPLQLVRGIAAIANGGTLVEPYIKNEARVKLKRPGVAIAREHLQTVRRGMRRAVTDGTAQGLSVPYVSVAAKTGTAEVGISKKEVNSWVVGFFPFHNPRYAFGIVMERGPRENTIGGLFVMRQMLDWMNSQAPEYIK